MKNNVTYLVFKKELLDIFRDRKTLIMSILIPLIVFPIMFAVLGKSINKTSKDVEENFKIAISDVGNSSLGQFLESQNGVKNQESKNITEDVKEGKILIGIEIPKDFDKSISDEIMSKLKITYDNSSQQSQMALSKVESFINMYSKQVVSSRLSKRNIDETLLSPVNIEKVSAQKESDGFGKLMLSLILPLLLVIYSVSGPIAPATDLGAGEKERGTLEPLLTTQANRMSLLWGKFLAITVMGFLTTLASIAGMLIAMKQGGNVLSQGNNEINALVAIEPKAIVLIAIVAVLTTMVFGALELAISMYARSFKEAQTYLGPLTIIAIIPAYATYMLDAKNIANYYFHIPLANSVCLLKELVSGIYNYNHMFITIGWTIIYILASIVFARYMFSKEEVVFRT